MVKEGIQLAKNMGSRYVAFRLVHELKMKMGLLKKRFPVNPPREKHISLEEWRNLSVKFFFPGPISMDGNVPDHLNSDFVKLKAGIFRFFSCSEYSLGTNYDWLTNPETGYKYSSSDHWTEINLYNKEAGDIKYVWEKSRFTFLYTIIRNDAYTGQDHAHWVFSEMLSWIKMNATNCGPNYSCSQEIALRVLNWTFALNFYKRSSALTEEVFQEIMHAVYWQIQHIHDNINFSRIAVRNNHAITETLTLYLTGLLFPFFPQAARWKMQGKQWFEEEILYQIYDDGTYLQFSVNYQRAIAQCLCWGIRLAHINDEGFRNEVYQRAEKCLQFLVQCMDTGNGWLPNYGANDGTLLFPLSDAHFRDYRPQLEALSLCLGFRWKYASFEEALWYGFPAREPNKMLSVDAGIHRFPDGGFYLFRSSNSLSFIRCGNHKDRPSQADNLHLDIWYQGKNLLHDGGSYKYNALDRDVRYFMGTASHNTVMLGGNDQMEKGARFIWYHWTQCEEIRIDETDEYYFFEGTIKAFLHVNTGIRHTRTVKVYKARPVWQVEDRVLRKPASLELRQIWHTNYPELLTWEARVHSGQLVSPLFQTGFASQLYTSKEACTEMVFSTMEDYICTIISVDHEDFITPSVFS